jgi:hypothetical protein
MMFSPTVVLGQSAISDGEALINRANMGFT